MVNLMAFLAVFVFGAGFLAVFMFAALLWRGYVLAVVWGWLAVPLFGLPEISTAAAIGLCALGSLLVPSSLNTDSNDDSSSGEKAAKAVGIVMLWPALALLVAWIVKP